MMAQYTPQKMCTTKFYHIKNYNMQDILIHKQYWNITQINNNYETPTVLGLAAVALAFMHYLKQ